MDQHLTLKELPVLTTRALPATLLLEGEPDLPATVLVRHDAAEPDLVRAVVLVDEDSFELPLDRGLLTDGLTGGAAYEDVQVQVVGELALVGVGALGLAFPLAPLADLLLATFAAAPTGAEPHRVIALEVQSSGLTVAG